MRPLQVEPNPRSVCHLQPLPVGTDQCSIEKLKENRRITRLLTRATGGWRTRTLASSLAFAGYDYAVAWSHGFHNDKHGRGILPDSLRELWRGTKA